jgi:hypothetical protein
MNNNYKLRVKNKCKLATINDRNYKKLISEIKRLT